MEKYYFTFGDSNKFPYQNSYLIVAASDYNDAVSWFQKKYPDIGPGILNCSDCCNEEKWEIAGKQYSDCMPSEIVWTETCFGKKPAGYGDIFVFVPDEQQIIRIAEGTGDNLLQEDAEEGYVDYVYYEQYELAFDMPETDGGQILLMELLRDKYQCLADCIPDVLEMAYGDSLTDCMILQAAKK